MFAMLKPGGTLGVVEHRLPENADAAREQKQRLRQGLDRPPAGRSGRLPLVGVARSTPIRKDTADQPEGVWTLPPSLRLGDQDRAKYPAIGESDRMTLRFVKPR